SGMKVAAILAVAGAIVGEFLGSDRGLGYLMLQVQVTLDTAAMFMAVILITLIGAVLCGLVLTLPRRPVVRDASISLPPHGRAFQFPRGRAEGLSGPWRGTSRHLRGDFRCSGGRACLAGRTVRMRQDDPVENSRGPAAL